jgi:hypothetical protein
MRILGSTLQREDCSLKNEILLNYRFYIDAWQNTGLDVGTSASAILQVWFGTGPFSFKLKW